MLQAIAGDQMTCKTIRGARQWRLPEFNPPDQLTWAHEIPGNNMTYNETFTCAYTNLLFW